MRDSKKIENCMYCNENYCCNCSDAACPEDFCSSVCEDLYQEETDTEEDDNEEYT